MTLIADVFTEIPAMKNMIREMSKKPVFQRTLRDRTLEMGRNTVAISIGGPLEYLIITVKVVALEKVSFSDT